MRPSLKTLGLLTFTVGIASGCAVKKAPPEVEFLSPSSTIAVAEGQAVNLAFAVRDPRPCSRVHRVRSMAHRNRPRWRRDLVDRIGQPVRSAHC